MCAVQDTNGVCTRCEFCEVNSLLGISFFFLGGGGGIRIEHVKNIRHLLFKNKFLRGKILICICYKNEV
jgi:hypothetical protein